MAGRPPFYDNVEDLQKAIDSYFETCVPEYLKNEDGSYVRDKFGVPVMLHRNPPTITGLALHLGFSSRQSLINYQGKKQFLDTITRAKTRVEKFIEEKLYDPDLRPQGVIFALFNHGWKSPSQTREEAPVDPSVIAKERKDNYRKLFGQYGGASRPTPVQS